MDPLYSILILFNLPILATIVALPFVANLKGALSEKSGGASRGAASYSRLTAMVGAVVLASFFWAMGNLVLVEIIRGSKDVGPLVGGLSTFVLVGAVLFLPYAFNKLGKAAAEWRRPAPRTVADDKGRRPESELTSLSPQPLPEAPLAPNVVDPLQPDIIYLRGQS
jgi:hypothetical protein